MWSQGSLVAQMVKNLPAVWETWVQSLGWEDPWRREWLPSSSILSWRISWIEESGSLQAAAAAAAKSLKSCLTLCDPIDGSPPGSPVSGILQPRTLEWVSISFSNA